MHQTSYLNICRSTLRIIKFKLGIDKYQKIVNKLFRTINIFKLFYKVINLSNHHQVSDLESRIAEDKDRRINIEFAVNI